MAIRKPIFRRRVWMRSALARPPAASLDAGTLAGLTEIIAAVGAA